MSTKSIACLELLWGVVDIQGRDMYPAITDFMIDNFQEDAVNVGIEHLLQF